MARRSTSLFVSILLAALALPVARAQECQPAAALTAIIEMPVTSALDDAFADEEE